MIKYLIMDVDGTLTDGKIYVGPNGEAMKAFSVKDGYVINYILKPANIAPVIITARTSPIVQQRCDELGISAVHQGKLDKLAILQEVVGNESLDACAYFGDDILDMKCMLPIKAAGGIVGCPADAVQSVRAISDYVCINKAGEGALREFAEWLVCTQKNTTNCQNRIENAKRYLESLDLSQISIGKKYVVNDDFYYFVQSYQPSHEMKLESHRDYVDIQKIISGEEVMHIADTSRLFTHAGYDASLDVILWDNPLRTVDVVMQAGDSIVLYPENAHGVTSSSAKCENVCKIVGKVRIH